MALWGRSILGRQNVPRKVPTKVPPRFHQGFTKNPPSFSEFHGVSRSVLGLPRGSSWAAKRFCGRFHRGSTKVSPRLRKFRDRFSLPSLLYVCLPVPSTCFTSFWTELALRSSAVVKVLGQNDTFVFWVLSSKWLSPPNRFFGVFPKLFCTFVSECPAVFGVNVCCFRIRFCGGFYISLPTGCYFIKSSLEGSANCALYWPPRLLLGSKLRELLTCFSHTNPARRKRCCWGIPWAYFLQKEMPNFV